MRALSFRPFCPFDGRWVNLWYLSAVCRYTTLHDTPKHTSWLNQIELWLSILVRRLLKRGNFTSVEDLRERILAFIAYFNKTMAKPFKWTYKGRPLTV